MLVGSRTFKDYVRRGWTVDNVNRRLVPPN